MTVAKLPDGFGRMRTVVFRIVVIRCVEAPSDAFASWRCALAERNSGTAEFAVAKIARKTPPRNTERPVSTRKLKKPDCEWDLFFILCVFCLGLQSNSVGLH